MAADHTASISKFYRSFSGTDSLVFILMPYTKPILLGSLTTISYSIFRDKKPVPLLGKINIGGFTRGTRVAAGTMIFTLINQHWVNELMLEAPWLQKYGKLKADELPIFDIMIVSANEYGASVAMFVYGVDITDEGQVLSVEDLFTENQFSFIARDVDTFSDGTGIYTDTQSNNPVQKITPFELQYSSQNPDAFITLQTPLNKNTYLDNSDMIHGDDIINLQNRLNDIIVPAIPVSGVYDTDTFEAVQKFQSQAGLPVTGAIDDTTYDMLMNGITNNDLSGVITAKNGAIIYQDASMDSPVVSNLNYKDSVTIISESDGWALTELGYLPTSSVYFSGNVDSQEGYPTLRAGDEGPAVTILQDALNSILGIKLTVNSIVDKPTVEAIKDYQNQHTLPIDGVVDEPVWISLKEHGALDPDKIPKTYKFDYSYNTIPGIYETVTTSLDPFNYGMLTSNFTKDTVIKLSVISTYPDGEREVFSKTFSAVIGSTLSSITADDLPEAFAANANHANNKPTSAEIIIYPLGTMPIKWTVSIK